MLSLIHISAVFFPGSFTAPEMAFVPVFHQYGMDTLDVYKRQVVEAYRSAALERGWTEDTSLNIELTTGGAWGNPFNTNWTDYNVLTDPANIEEYLYGREYARNAEPEDMYFHVVVEEYSDYWEIYFIFA